MKIFISSVQKEFELVRKTLAEFIAGDALLSRQFETFLFERDIPASDQQADAVFLEEVASCNLYIGLFGNQYGWENENGLSPTHLEFLEATRLGKPRLIYVKGETDNAKHPKMQQLIADVGEQLVRRRFNTVDELRTVVYASLVNYLEETGVIRMGPGDATADRKATLDDLDPEAITRFVRRARKARNFPLPVESELEEVLTHLNLLDAGKPTHAAVLLFARQPQRFMLTSEVKCAHFHGTEAAKPIPSHQVYKGTAFELVDQAIDFVMSKINLSVGTRVESARAPVEYEIPRDVVAEAIVNAIAHRDYNSTASVQVMLFSNRLEVWNPGTLPPALTLDKLREPHGSFPGNPLLAEPLYLAKYIERMGTGTGDMIAACIATGLPEPDFRLTDGFVTTIWRSTGGVGGQVGTKWHQVGTKSGSSQIIRKCLNPSVILDLMEISGRTDRTKFRNQVLKPLLEAGLVEMTIPRKPTSSNQRYRLTRNGLEFLQVLEAREEGS